MTPPPPSPTMLSFFSPPFSACLHPLREAQGSLEVGIEWGRELGERWKTNSNIGRRLLKDEGIWREGRDGQWVLCCVFSVKQLVMSRKGSISEEMWSKDHLPTDWSLPCFYFFGAGGQLGLNYCPAWKEVRFLAFLAFGSKRKHNA